MCVSWELHTSPKESVDTLQLELQVAVNLQMWMLRMELSSSTKAVHVLNR